MFPHLGHQRRKEQTRYYLLQLSALLPLLLPVYTFQDLLLQDWSSAELGRGEQGVACATVKSCHKQYHCMPETGFLRIAGILKELERVLCT